MWNFLGRYDRLVGRRSKRQASYEPPKIDYDVAFIIDSSGSISERKFKEGLLALGMMIDRAQPDTLYSAVVYSTSADVSFKFTNATFAKLELQRLTYMKGWTNTQEALLKCRTDLIESDTSNARPRSRKRLLIVTDGQSNVHSRKTLHRALELKRLLVEIFVVAVGDYIPGINEVVGLASSTDAHLYRVENFEGLIRVMKLIPPFKKENTWLSDMYDNSRHRHRHRH